MGKEIDLSAISRVVQGEFDQLRTERGNIPGQEGMGTRDQNQARQFRIDQIHYQQKGIKRITEALGSKGIQLDVDLQDPEFDRLEDIRKPFNAQEQL